MAVDPYLISTHLADDATVAYHAALQFAGRAYSVWRRFHFLTAVRTRQFRYRDLEFVPVLVPSQLGKLPGWGGGILEVHHAGGRVRTASLERTMVDVLHVPVRSGGWEEVWRSLEMVEFFDLDEVVAYALLLGSALTVARVGFFLDQHRESLMVADQHLGSLRSHAPKQPRYFDSARRAGRLVRPWNVIVPHEILQRSWEDPG